MVTHGNLRVKLERNYPGLQLALIFWESRYPKIPQLRRTSISYHGFLYGNHSYKLPCSTGAKYTERFSGQSFRRVPANSKVNLPWSVSMRFRTAKPSGTLLEISFSSSSSVSEVSYVNQGTCFKSHGTFLYLRELRCYFSWLMVNCNTTTKGCWFSNCLT